MGVWMDKYIGMILIGAICLITLIIGALHKKAEWLMNFLVRGILGTISIYFLNIAFLKVGLQVEVGINAITVLTSAMLGFPGVAVLYGLGLYQIL
jgi:inhibitor of the pro-sigma K processing machinery